MKKFSSPILLLCFGVWLGVRINRYVDRLGGHVLFVARSVLQLTNIPQEAAIIIRAKIGSTLSKSIREFIKSNIPQGAKPFFCSIGKRRFKLPHYNMYTYSSCFANSCVSLI